MSKSGPSMPAFLRYAQHHCPPVLQSRKGLEYWLPLAASVLANQSQAISIVTAPHSQKVAFKHLELIATRASQVLMVLVLIGGEIQQHILSLDTIRTQEQLSQIAAQINHLCQNATLDQIKNLSSTQDALVNRVIGAVIEQLSLASKLVTGELYLDGLTNILAEPEFFDYRQDNSPLRLLEERPMLDDLISRTILTEEIGGVQWVIVAKTSAGTPKLLGYFDPIRRSRSALCALGILGPCACPTARQSAPCASCRT